jgi:pyruvate formate lyase activating enzyme
LHDLLRQKTADWVDGAVVTGGEPCIAPGTPQLVRLLKEQGWRVKLDTNGSRPDRLAALLPEVDYVAMDVKCAPETYPELTGFDDTDRIRESIDLLRESACAYEFRTTVLPDLHTDRELVAVGAAVRGAQRLALQAFVPRDHLPDPRYRRLPRTPPERLREAADLLRPFVRDIELRGVEAGHRAA